MANILKSFLNSFSSASYRRPTQDEEGMFLTQSLWSVSPQFNDYITDREIFNVIFTNPALLKVVCLQCDLFSLGKIKITNSNGVEQKNDPLLKLLLNPNSMQSDSQFLWDLMFWYMTGNVYCYVDTNVPTEDNTLYFLETSKMEWPNDFDKQKDKMVLSKQTYNNLLKTNINYRFEDGTSRIIPLSKIICLTDLSNGQGNWFKGKNRITALHKILCNADESLSSININTRYSGKFLVAGQQDPKDVSKLPMGDEEKKSIEQKVNGRKQVHAVKSLVDIKRFVENAKQLGLDETYRSAYFFIGSMFNIPKDVLEAYLQGATFENQEKATARHISYTLQPKADDFFGALGRKFNYTDKIITMSWDHLPFMQVFEKEKSAVNYQNMQTMTGLLKLGIDIKEINQLLGTNFKTAKYEQPKGQGGNAGSGA